MFASTFKTILAAAVVAGGAAFMTAAPANAGGKIGVYIGGGHGGIYFGNGHYRPGPGYHAPRRHKGFCGPRKAVNKAWRMGLNRPHVSRVGGKRIAVVGWNRGHRAKVVFAKHTRHCRVVKTRGLY